jgi:hypothetical protein
VAPRPVAAGRPSVTSGKAAPSKLRYISVSREPLSDGARLACLDQANRALFQSALVGVPASILLVLILGASVPIEARRSFVAVVCLADVVTFLASGAYLRRRRNGEAVARYWVGPCCTAATGVAWGSLAIMGLPDEVEPRVVYLLFVCGTSATFVVGAAARRLYYFSSQTPMLFLVALGFFASSDRTTRLLGRDPDLFRRDDRPSSRGTQRRCARTGPS